MAYGLAGAGRQRYRGGRQGGVGRRTCGGGSCGFDTSRDVAQEDDGPRGRGHDLRESGRLQLSVERALLYVARRGPQANIHEELAAVGTSDAPCAFCDTSTSTGVPCTSSAASISIAGASSPCGGRSCVVLMIGNCGALGRLHHDIHCESPHTKTQRGVRTCRSGSRNRALRCPC